MLLVGGTDGGNSDVLLHNHAIAQEVARTCKPHFEEQVVDLAGNDPRVYDVSIIPLVDDDGAFNGLVSVRRDVTTQREAQRALERWTGLARAPKTILGVLRTLLIVLVGWVAFRATGISTAMDFYAGMLGLNGWALPFDIAVQITRESPNYRIG